MAEYFLSRGIPRSLELSQILKIREPLGAEWVSDLWASLLDAHLLVFSIHKQILPRNETLDRYDRDFNIMSTTRETHMMVPTISDIFTDSLLDHSILDHIWKPIASYVCEKELKQQDRKTRLDLGLQCLYLVFYTRTRHIALFVQKMQSVEYAGSKEMQDGLDTLKKMVTYVDQMLQHPLSKEDSKASTQNPPSKHSPAPIHLGKEINRECWSTYVIKAGFDTSTRKHYISFRTKLFVLCVTHAMAIVIVFYLHWWFWLSLVVCILCNALAECSYFGDFEPSARIQDDPNTKLRSDVQIFCLHALMYACLNLSVRESAYILLWSGMLLGLNRLSEYYMTKRTRKMQHWPQLEYDALAMHFVVCGIHLRHGWLSLAVGSWVTGTVVSGVILAQLPKTRLPKPNFIQCLYTIDVPALYLLLYLVTSVSVVRTAISFLYQLFIPIVMDMLIKWIMDILGWRSSPIDLSGSIMRGFMNVLMVFWGFSPWQAFGLTMAMQTFSSLQQLAPSYGMT